MPSFGIELNHLEHSNVVALSPQFVGQGECDNHGARLLDRYVKFRRLAQLVRDIASVGSLRQAGGGLAAEATLAVDPRQARVLLLP